MGREVESYGGRGHKIHTPICIHTHSHDNKAQEQERKSQVFVYKELGSSIVFFFNNFNSVDFPLVKFLKDCSNSLLAPLKYVRKENKVTSLQTSGAYPEDFVSQCC